MTTSQTPTLLSVLNFTTPLGRLLLRRSPVLTRHAAIDKATRRVTWQLQRYGQPVGPTLTGTIDDYGLELTQYTLRPRWEVRH